MVVGSVIGDAMVFDTLGVCKQGAVLFVEIAAPPMNLLGPALVGDLVSLIQRAEADDGVRVLVFRTADPEYFIAHVDVNRIKEYREEAAKLVGEASIGLLFRHLSASRLITIAQIEGRVRGAGSEFVLACDMRFAARESAIFGQPEPGLGTIPGAGAVQHLTRLMGRGRALEVMLSAQDYDAELAERYGWINRAMAAETLDDFVRSLAHRIAGFPAAGLVALKDRSTTSRSRRSRTSVATPISSARACARPRSSGACKRRSIGDSRRGMPRWHWGGCWAI
jgi:enoyl-CoA hydratase/carnithine racemase